MGNPQFPPGQVGAKREEDGQKGVDLEWHMITQRDPEPAYGTATVALPSRTDGLPLFPRVPVTLERQAAELFARHSELSAQRRRR